MNQVDSNRLKQCLLFLTLIFVLPVTLFVSMAEYDLGYIVLAPIAGSMAVGASFAYVWWG